MEKYYKRGKKYLGKYPDFNALIHILVGVGVGMLLTYPLAGTHPVRWGLLFLALGGLGHLWAMR